MLKRNQMIVAAAALAAAPLGAKAAISITFAYDTTVTYGAAAALTTNTSTVAIVGNAVTIPSGDFFKFNVNVLVTGDTNAASGGVYDTNNGTTQPPLLGLAGFGFVIGDSAPANVVPRVVGGNAVVTVTTTGGAYDVAGKGSSSAATGQVGSTAAPLSGGMNPGSTTGPSGYYRLTLGAGAAQDIFTALTYQALTGSQAILTPTNTVGSIAYAVLAQKGSATTAPSYISDTVGSNPGDVVHALPALTINGGVTPPSGHSIVALTAATAGNPTNYGTSKGTVTVTGSNGNYIMGQLAVSPAAATGFVEGKTFTPATDKEIYALDVTNGAGQASDIAAIVNAINNGVSAQSIPASVGVVASATAPAGTAFPGIYDLFLTFATPPSGDNFLGWDLAETGSGIASGDVVSSVALVPEPASAALLLIGASGLLLGRRRKELMA